MTPLKLNLSEIFASIQGEGRYLGTPSIFVRTSGCNLRCQWNGTRCDTPYTSWEARGSLMTVEDVCARVVALADKHPAVRHVVITGGEPMLQPHLHELVRRLHEEGYYQTIETNGTMANPLEADFISISPKLASSVPDDPRLAASHEKLRIVPEALTYWVENYDYQFKFVINEAEDEAEIDQLLATLKPEVPPQRIYLMPQGIDAAQLAEHGKLCIAICLRRGWRYTPRAHIEIYGNRPGT